MQKESLNGNADKSEVMMMGGGDERVCVGEVCVDERQMDHASVFKYLGFSLD